jgi:hypothetical protein
MRYLLLAVFLNYYPIAFSQSPPAPETSGSFKVGYMNLITVDSGRIYKQNTGIGTKLHFRPIEIDVWYPSIDEIPSSPIQYGYFLNLLQERSNRFQNDTVYNEMTTGLVDYLSSNLIIRDTSTLMHLPTVSYTNADPFPKRFPLLIYLCSYNGMSYENVAFFEWLAARGYFVACITSVGRYPGNMSTRLSDLMEQVLDADFGIRYLKTVQQVDTSEIGIIGYSWGGLAALILAMNNTQIKCLLSLDGSEVHYYGDSKEEDLDFDLIINSHYCRGKKLNIPFAYLESGFKQFDESADSIFPISSLTMHKILYIRFPKAKHEDFSYLTSLGPKVHGTDFSGPNPYIPYKQFALRFLNENLKKGKNELLPFLDSLYQNRIADSSYPLVKIKKNLILVKGKIVDEYNRESLAFVNVGIRNKNIGTVSSQDGNFQLSIDPALKKDSLTFSMAGYQTRIISLKDLLGSPKPFIVSLRVKIFELKEVSIISKAMKTEVLGNTTTSRFVSIGLPLKFLGSETGIRLHLGKKPVLLKSFSFNISDNRLDTAVFRMNIYSMKNGAPFENILHQNILIPVGKQTGKYTLDLHTYKLVLNGDILLSLEWIAGTSSGYGNGIIFLSAGFLNSATWHRLTSQAEWKKATGLGVGFNVVIQKLQG